MTWEPSEGNANPKQWQSMSVFTSCGTKRDNFGIVTESCGKLKEGRNYFNKVCLYRVFSATTPVKE
jgi:hypothetical protein